MQPQSTLRKPLCTQKDFPLKDLTQPANVFTRAGGKGWYIDFNVILLKDGIKRLVLERAQRRDNRNPRKLLKTKYFSAISVVIFWQYWAKQSGPV